MVWAGAPLESKWDGGPEDPPSRHHWLDNATDQGHWAVDLPAPEDAPVIAYVAPEEKGTVISTWVDEIGDACTSGRKGAKFVTIGIYRGTDKRDDQKIGSITYGHLKPLVTENDEIARWGTEVGRLAGGLPVNEKCWSGPHVHVQMFSKNNFACYNKGYSHEYAVHPKNFIGFVGGNKADGPYKACP